MILPVNVAVSMFSNPGIEFVIKEGQDDARGQWVEAEIDSGTITAKISPPSDKDLDILEPGEISNGAQVIHGINISLPFIDTEQDSTEAKQTYIDWQGSTWRVKSVSNRTHDGAYLRYGLVRHIDRVAP